MARVSYQLLTDGSDSERNRNLKLRVVPPDPSEDNAMGSPFFLLRASHPRSRQVIQPSESLGGKVRSAFIFFRDGDMNEGFLTEDQA